MGVQRKDGREPDRSESSLEELSLLAETAGADVVGMALQRLPSPHPATYIGKGKLDEIKAQRTSDGGYTMVVFDEEEQG